MKILVCGSRAWGGWDDKTVSWKPTPDEYWQMTALTSMLTGLMDRALVNGEQLKIIHGACPSGADAIAAKWAASNDIETIEYPADWSQYGKRAGFVRNQQMIVEGRPIVVVAAWDGQSKGTKHTIDLAEKHSIPCIRIG